MDIRPVLWVVDVQGHCAPSDGDGPSHLAAVGIGVPLDPPCREREYGRENERFGDVSTIFLDNGMKFSVVLCTLCVSLALGVSFWPTHDGVVGLEHFGSLLFNFPL